MKTTNSVTKETLESLYSILSYREYDIDRVMELVRIMIDSIVPEVS